jgi:hypothetical protein
MIAKTIAKTVNRTTLCTLACVVSLAAAGCASESAAFRQMSAADHENAARTVQGDPALAQAHLDAASRLRAEEANACAGVPDADRVNGPFAQAGRVSDVEVVRDRGPFPKGPQQAVGVAVTLRAEPGLTEQWLGRVVECNRAYLAVVGSSSRTSPLSVPDTRVSVSSTYGGFRVTVTSKDAELAKSVVDHGQMLALRNGAPTTGFDPSRTSAQLDQP